MKIDDTLSGGNNMHTVNRAQMASEVSSAAAASKPENDSEGDLAGKDSATLGAGATLASHMAHVSDVRMEKVAGVQQAMAAGSYYVDAGKVADKIILSILQKQP